MIPTDIKTVLEELAQALSLWNSELAEYVGFQATDDADTFLVEVYGEAGQVLRTGTITVTVTLK